MAHTILAPRQGSYRLSREGKSGDILQREWLRACLTGKNDFWGILQTRPLYLWVGKGVKTEWFRRGKPQGMSGQTKAPINVGDLGWANEHCLPPTRTCKSWGWGVYLAGLGHSICHECQSKRWTTSSWVIGTHKNTRDLDLGTDSVEELGLPLWDCSTYWLVQRWRL